MTRTEDAIRRRDSIDLGWVLDGPLVMVQVHPEPDSEFGTSDADGEPRVAFHGSCSCGRSLGVSHLVPLVWSLTW